MLLTLPEAGFYEYFASGCVVPIGTIPAIKFRTNKQTNKQQALYAWTQGDHHGFTGVRGVLVGETVLSSPTLRLG